jgi:hypothetical protein
MEVAWHLCFSVGIELIDEQPLMGGRLRLHNNERNLGFMSFPASRTMDSVE